MLDCWVQCRGVFVVVYCSLCLDCIVAFVICGGVSLEFAVVIW